MTDVEVTTLNALLLTRNQVTQTQNRYIDVNSTNTDHRRGLQDNKFSKKKEKKKCEGLQLASY